MDLRREWLVTRTALVAVALGWTVHVAPWWNRSVASGSSP